MTLRLSVLVALAASAPSVVAQCPPDEVAGFTAPGIQLNDLFGATVATSGDVAVVGCRGFDSPLPYGDGAAFVYVRDPLDAHAWTLAHTLLAPAGFMFYGWTVALDGDVAAIACMAPAVGVVQVLERDAGGPHAWGQVATLRSDYYPFVSGDGFGRGLVVDGDTIAVGAPQHGGSAGHDGSVYVFERDAGGPNNWGKIRRIVRPNTSPTVLTDFGLALALEGDTLVIGDERAAHANGRVYVHQRDLGGTNQWGLAETLLPSSQFIQYGGSAVAIGGDQIFMGMRAAGGNYMGRVRVFDRVGGAWLPGALLAPTSVSSGAEFGTSLAFDREKLVVGAPRDSSTPGKQGSVFVFDHSVPLGWTEVARLQASDGQSADWFGINVSLWRDQLVVGNSRNDIGSPSGKVHVFDLESPQPPVSYCTAGTSNNGCTGTLHGVGAPSASNFDGFELVAVGLDGQRTAGIFYGVTGPIAIPVPGTGSWRCVQAPLQRTGIVNSGGTAGACDGSVSVDWNAFRATHPGALGAPFGAGQTIWTQAWNRGAHAPAGLPATQGLEFVLCP